MIKLASVLSDIRNTLQDHVEDQVLNSKHNYFKEKVRLYGVRVYTVTKLSKEFIKTVQGEPKAAIFELCEALWQSGFNEEQYIACNLAEARHKEYEPADFEVFEHWVNNYVTNWSTCDTLCNHTIGTFIEMYPSYLNRLKQWALSSNRWARRAAAVTLIIPARKGLFLNDIFEIADLLLTDSDDLVQKGYGWMLKAASEAYQQEVYEYVLNHKVRMPRTSLRYAIEKMPLEMRKEVMKK